MHVDARPAAGREVGASSFAGVTTANVVSVDWRPGGVLRVTFDRDLDTATLRRVRDWLVSDDDADFQRRGALRKAAADGATNLAAMTAAYVLGDPMPAPILPAPMNQGAT